MQANKLLTISSELFNLATKIELIKREQVIDAFKKLEQQAQQLKITAEEIQHTQYALTAYIDEIVLTSGSALSQAWVGKPLQLEFFGEHIAGESFFQRLAQLRQAGSNMINVLEIYYACLQLGFMGKYRLVGHEQLSALQVDLYQQISMARGAIDESLVLNDSCATNLVSKQPLSLWKLMLFFVGGLFVIYLGLMFDLSWKTDKVLKKISISRQSLLKELTHLKDYENK